MIEKLLKVIKPVRYLFDKYNFKKKFKHNFLPLKNTYKDRPLLIVGNGPSLNKTPLDKFSDIPSIGMNKINLLFDRTDWRPSMIVCANGLVMRQNSEFFTKTDIPVHVAIKGYYLNRIKSDNISYFLERTDREFSKDLTQGCGLSGTVTFIALQYAYYLGADPVIVVGVDHSFKTSGGRANKIEIREEETDENHFDPNYFAKGQAWGLPNLDLSEKGYLKAREAFEEDGRQIYDATIDGKLNIFKKISIESAIKIANNKH